uniref:TERF1-interacting nuclear factor 2 N-terminal domain-containing protein n=1 Tax=Sphenodon punctatus TaxID=8508 RepID=A0A8D0HQG5_SPHPU
MASAPEAAALHPPSGDSCASLRLVAAAAWHTVRERETRDYPRVLGLLGAVGEAAPNLVRYRHFAKLRLGLQAAVIMKMLQEEQPDGKVYDAVDMYFPEREPQIQPQATARDRKLVQEAQETFRELVLGLLRDRQRREEYVQDHLEADYGESFLRVVEELLYDYLWQMERALPEPCLPQLLEVAWTHSPAPQPLHPPQEIGVLSRYLSDMGYQPPASPREEPRTLGPPPGGREVPAPPQKEVTTELRPDPQLGR